MKNVFTLFSGTVIAQALTLLAAPVISRLYTPNDVGFFGIFGSVVSGIAVIACGRFELTILLPKSDHEAKNNISLAMLFCLFSSALTFIVILFLYLFNVVHNTLFLLIGVSVFALGIFQINNNIALREKKYKLIARSKIVNSLLNLVTSLSFGFAGLLSSGLVLAYFIAQLFSNLVFKTRFNIHQTSKFYYLKLISTLRRYKDFLKFNTLQALSDMFMINAMFYILPGYFNSAIIGFYSLAMRILQAPMSLIGSSIAQVFYQKATENHHLKIPNRKLVFSTITKSALVALPVPIVLLLFGPQLFSFIFGKPWLFAGKMAQILAPWVYLDFVRATISQIPLILNKQKELLKLSLTGNILLLGSLLMMGHYSFDIQTSLLVVSIVMSLYTLVNINWIYKLVKF